MQIFHDAFKTGVHKCYLHEDTRLPMMYIQDCLRSLYEVIQITSYHILYYHIVSYYLVFVSFSNVYLKLLLSSQGGQNIRCLMYN